MAGSSVIAGFSPIARWSAIRVGHPYTRSKPLRAPPERAQRILGYRPVASGRYVDESLVW